jgi:hypothetical protein
MKSCFFNLPLFVVAKSGLIRANNATTKCFGRAAYTGNGEPETRLKKV